MHWSQRLCLSLRRRVVAQDSTGEPCSSTFTITLGRITSTAPRRPGTCSSWACWAVSLHAFGPRLTPPSGTSWTAFFLITRERFPQTVPYVGGTWVKCTIPLTATLVLGSTLTCMLSRARGKKDDCWNQLLGFLPTSVIWTSVMRNSGKGFAVGSAFALLAVFLKQCDLQGAPQFNSLQPMGRRQESGTFGGRNWGDMRFLTPGLEHTDPGRRPPV